MTGNTLAAFVIAYERTEFVLGTIKNIFEQQPKPVKILIVDNSITDQVFSVVKACQDYQVSFFSLKENVGPAGAAKTGLQQLTDEGFDWIYWGDDDDPPTDPKTFERLLEIASENPKAGIVGKVGGKFIPSRARTRVFSNAELNPVTEADYVTGGKQMIVSAKLVKAGVLPNPKLFFGFEELDFCLRAKDAGFSVLIDGQAILEARSRNGNSDPSYRWRGNSYGRKDQLNRQYYSLRNLLYILNSRNEWLGYFFLLAKTIGKMVLSFRYGIGYGSNFCKSQALAVLHERRRRMGQYVVFP